MQMEDGANDANGVDDLLQETEPRLIHFGNLDRKAKERGSLLRFNADSTYIACQAAGMIITQSQNVGSNIILARQKYRVLSR